MNYCFDPKITDNAPVGKKAILRIMSPATGSVTSLSEAHSLLYRSRILGEGVAIALNKGEIYAPSQLVITRVDMAKGAVLATTTKGLKLLFQLGHPEHHHHSERMQFHVKTGDKINAKQCLVTCDPLWMKQQGTQPYLYFTLLNARQLAAIQCHSFSDIRALEEPLFTLFANAK